jgi:hypothetical protein
MPDERAPAPTRDVEPLLWDLPQLAAALNVSLSTAKRLAAKGALPPDAVVHVLRRRLFRRDVIEAWVRQGCPDHRPQHKRWRRGGWYR